MRRRSLSGRGALLGAVALAGHLGVGGGTAMAQDADNGSWYRPDIFGQASVTSDFYRAGGIEGRRPGSAWRMNFAPQMALFGDVRMGLDLLVSSEGSDLRQNINQLGVSPSWAWGTAHLGDFSQGYSEFTVQGIRIRGAGLEVRPNNLRFAVQGGRVQRAIAPSAVGAIHRRNLLAVKLGYGDAGSNHLHLNMVRVRDDLDFIETGLVVLDTMVVDTLPDLLRPETLEQPQENLTAGLSGQIDLLERRLRVRGEVAGALLTRDLSSPEVVPESVDQTGVGLVGKLMPLRTSTTGDLAMTFESQFRTSRFGLVGGMEHIGPGFNSLGLAYLYNDRRSYHLGGDTRFYDNRVVVQGRVQQQKNNLLGQRRATTRRLAGTGTVNVRVTDRLNVGVTGMRNIMDNDAAVDTFRIDHRADAFMTNASWQYGMLGLPSVLTVAYGLQQTRDGNVVMPVPEVLAHNVSLSVQVNITPTITFAPIGSAVVTRMDGGSGQHNIYAGFRAGGRFLDNRIRSSAGVTRTFSHGREIFGANAQLSAPAPGDLTLTVRARHQNHSAFGSRPAFNESFLTMSVSRSF